MLIYCYDTEEDEEIKVDENTTKFCIGFFGFYPHSSIEYINSFISKDLKLNFAENNDFKISKESNLITDVYHMSDRRTVDISHIIGKVFNSKESAFEYINEMISSSDNVARNLFSDIDVFDGDKFTKINEESINEENIRENFKIEIQDEMKDKLNELFIHYQAEPVAMEILKETQSSLEDYLGELNK